MKTNNKNSKFNIVTKKAIFMSSAIALSLGVIALNFTKEDPYFYKLRSNFDSELPYIKDASTPEATNHVTMTYVNENPSTSYTGKVITIENADELGYFSSLCNSSSKDTFLKYNYILIDNIDATSINGFNPIGWENSHAFKGTFDGQGYEIRGLDLIINQTTTYTGTYYSMFGINQGTIQNVGLYYPNIAISGTVTNLGNGGVSYLVGLNDEVGTVDHCFVVDDGYVLDSQKATSTDEELKRSGITAPDQRISTLCINNKGTLTNNYVAVGVVADIQYQFAEMAEITLANSGTFTNNNYYNKSIQSIVGDTVTFKDGYGIESRSKSQYGTRCVTSNDLISALSSTYYTKNSYGSLGSYTGIKYGITRGMDYDTSTMTFTVENAYDFAYMFELFNTDAHLAADNVSFKIIDNIDLSLIPVTAYSYAKGIGATIYGDKLSNYYEDESYEQKKKVTMIDNNKSDYPTIYNADVMNPARIAKNVGVDCYGLFNFVTGKIQNLNLYTTTMDLANVRTIGDDGKTIANIKGIGALCGYVEQGEIDGVNVFANVTNTSDTSIGEYYLGGITGILGGNGVIKNSTSAGSINIGSKTNSVQTSTYMSGIAVGGIVGYIESSSGNVRDCTNAMNITLGLGSNITYAVGGVIGAGYTTSSPYTVTSNGESVEKLGETSNLENVGNITVGISGSSAYNELYVSGVLGRHLGMTAQVKDFNNYGNITVYSNTSKDTYVSGVSNADIKTTSNNGLKASEFVNTANQYLYYASGFKNGGKVVVNTSANSNMLYYTNVLNIKASNGFISKVDGLFNLSYYSKYNAASSTVGLEKTKTAIDDQEINMNKFYTFAPVANVIGGSSAYRTELDNAYNLRNINYTINSAITTATNLNYTGCVYGEYVTYNDCRNEGNLKFTLNKAITGNLTVSGLFNEVSSGAKANNLYNAGNIDIKYTATFTGNIYASGVCFENKNGFTDNEIVLFNPSSDKYNKDLVGSINNAINSGKVTVTNPDYANITFSESRTKSSNGHLETGSYFYPTGEKSNNITSISASNLIGTICTSGIVVTNKSVITNTFNIADIFAANYINDRTKRNEINASGLVSYNVGKYAIVENSANDGNIKAINMSFYMNFNNGQSQIIDYTATNAFVTSSGIICHNDEQLNNHVPTIGSNENSKQIVAFTINYGAIYSYNYYCNSTSSASEDFRSISAGVVGQGLLNLVNVMNYGNIYGSEIAGGVFGVVFFNTFASEISDSNKVNLANTINYSPVLVIDKGELELRNASTGTTYSHQTYTTFVGLNSTTTQYYYVDIPVYAKDYFNGSIFGIINFNGDTKAQNVDIRYLISFNEDVKLVGAEAQTPTVTVDVSKFYSAYIKFEGGYVLDTYIGNTVTYAPISSGSETINNVTYYGVFNTQFPFYQAIQGNSTYLDIDHHRTDIFISDYFEFIGATYVNSILLDKIGWGEIAYTAAADAFATDLAGVAKFIEYAKTNNNAQYTTLINEALNTDTWLSKCDNQVLIDVTNTLLANEEENTLLQMIDYIFSAGSTTYSMITSSTRTAILEAILAQDSTLDYSTLLDQIITYVDGYSNLLANSVLDSNDEAGNYLKNYISSLSNSAVEDILNTYCTYLKDASQNSYFTFSNSAQIRYDILSAIFENIASNTFYENLAEVLGIDTILNNFQRDSKAAMYEGYNNLIKENKIALYKAIIINNSSATSLARINTYITNMASEIDYFANIILKGYSKTSLENIYTDTSVGEEASGSSKIDERVALWNQIRVTDVFKSYLTSQLNDEGYSEGYIAKATEFRNTYQTNTLPRDTADDLDGDLSYTYTFNITPSTYFLGPYKSTAKDYWKYHVEQVVPTNGDSADGADNSDKAIIDVMSKNEAEYLYNNGYTYGYQLFYYEYSDASSNNQLCAVQRTGEGTYAFAWRNGNNTDFTGGFINGTYDTLGNWSEAESIQVLDYDTNQYFDANGGGISKFTYISGNGDWTTATGVANVNGKWTITDANNKVHNVRGTLKDWADFILEHEIRHYIGYPTAKWHTTRMSGLFKYRSGVRWFTWKHNETTRRVHTSQYIDYNVDQLLQLDGYLTLYDDGTTKDSTEREIINDIFNDILNSNSNNFKRVIAAALLERSAYIDNDSYYKVEIPTINQNFTSYYNIEATKATSIDTSKKYYNLVDDDYIEVDIKNINSSNYNSYYWITVSRGLIYDSTKTYYIRKNIDDYDYEYLDNYFINNIYSDTIVGSGNKAFDYLYQTNNTKTVKAYLTDGLSSDLKNKFISYCSTNQSAYSKLLLELIKLNSIDISNFNFEFPVTIGNSTDLNAISIDNITSYTNLVCENKEVSIYNEDTDENYNLTHGYTFSQMVLSLTDSYQDLVILVGPKNTTGSFTYKIGNGNTRTQNVTENTIVTLTLNNNTSVTLNSTNQNVVIYGIFGHNTISYQYSDTMSFRYTLLDEENNATEKPGYYEWTLPTNNQIKTQIENRLDMYDIDYTDYTYTVATTIKSANFSSGSDDQIRYHRIVDVISENNKVVIDTTTKKLGSNESFTYSVLLDNSYLGHKIRRQTSKDGTAWGEGTDKTKSGYYRFRLSYISMYITVNYNATGYNHIYTNFIDQDSIIDSVNRANNMSPENKAAKTFKNSTDYATKYPKFLVDAAHNLIPIDYSEVEYRSSLVSGLYYVNYGNSYSYTTGVYDNTKKYYTKNGNDYNEANINESTYIETIHSGKYYVSYQLANVPYNSNTIYYTKNGNIYTKLNSLSEQDFYSSVNIINNTYYVVTDNSDPDNLVYGLAGNTYDSNTTYYTRSGEGTLDDPYVYTQANITIAQFYAGGTSNTYYVNGGTDYHLATRAFDNNLTYYTYDNGVYTVAGISSIEYYNSTISNVYYSNFELASDKFVSGIKYYTRSGLGTEVSPYVYTPVSLSSATYYSSCTSNKYYVSNGGSYVSATGDYNSSTDYYKLEDTEYVLYGTASKNIKGLLNLSYKHTSGTPEYCVPDLIAKLITSSNEAFKSFIDNVVSQSSNNVADYKTILQYLITNIGYYALNDAIKSSTSSITTMLKEKITAAFLVTDYKYILNNNANVYDSRLRHYIYYVLQNYQYINQNGTYDINKFYEFCDEIGYDLSTAGYGIYALASNQGKLDGLYIPDNLDIKTMDAPYAEITIKNEQNADVNVRSLQNSKSPYWRGGTTVDLENKDTVNYAFYKDMKQIEASISTAVFELDINYNNTIYYGDIDLDKKTVTFYVPSLIVGTYTITKQEYAYEAESDLGNTISVTSTTSGATQETFTVTAQNTSVTATYKIIFETIDVDFDLTYSDNSTSKSYDAFDNDLPITLKLTSVEGKELPKGLNLEHYISFVGTNTYTPFDENPVISLSASSVDHIVDADGDATITIIISPKLKADEYQITVSMLSGTASVTFEKKASYDKEITKFSYNGEPLTFDEYDTVESVIPFGRAFDYEELTDPDSGRFYLNEFEYSNNATVVITATNTTIDEHGLMTYVVTFSVTAEAGGDAREYTHKLKEKQYFDEPEDEYDTTKVYANLYVDGDVVETTDSYDSITDELVRLKYLSGGTFAYALASDDFNGTAGTSLHDNMLMKVSFNRGVEPQYRVKYVLDNFYTLGSNVEFKPTAATSANLASIQNTYAGLTVTVTNNNNTGVYTFVYTYTNKGMWSDGEYERYYEFPELIIEKLASTDALLHEITFLEEAVSLGNTATVILPNTVLIPNRDDSGDDKIVGYDSNDVVYNEAFTDTQYQNIKVSSRGINYTNDSDSTDISDYFIIGTVSNADLSYYCPNFGINKYAQMYQYTTSEKLMHYGAGVDSEGHNIQTRTDHAILTDHRAVNTMYLYVPFTNGTDKEIFLVEIDSNGYWTNVYRTTFNGTNASATVNNKPVTVGAYPANTVKTLYAKDAAALNGYYVCDYAGSSTNNDSLFMDYVGTPVDGHFWYVSYVIFSEDKLSDGNLAGNIRYYHISLIDLTNNIQFYVTVYAKPTLNPSDLYLTIAENSYDKKTGVQTKTQISAYAVNNNNEVYDNDSTEEDRDDIDGYKIYRLRYDLQSLPHGYFYFYIDLPDGYVATAHTNKVNQLIIYEADGKTVKSRDERYLTEAGSFLPFSSIITQKVDLEIIVDEGTGEDASAWAVATSDIYTRQAKYEGLIPA